MLERLPSRVLVDPVIDLAIIGQPQLAEGPYRAERRSLGAEIRAADIHYVHQIAQSRRDPLQVRQRDLALAAEHGMHVIPAGARRHVPFRDIADALWVGNADARNQCDIAERSAAEI